MQAITLTEGVSNSMYLMSLKSFDLFQLLFPFHAPPGNSCNAAFRRDKQRVSHGALSVWASDHTDNAALMGLWVLF